MAFSLFLAARGRVCGELKPYIANLWIQYMLGNSNLKAVQWQSVLPNVSGAGRWLFLALGGEALASRFDV
jgi:hypothetical protein